MIEQQQDTTALADLLRRNRTEIRALAEQGIEVVLAGSIEALCRQAMVNLGIEVVDG